MAPDDADLHGDQITIEGQGGQPNIGYWDRADEWAAWTIQVDRPGVYSVRTSIATMHANAAFVMDAAGQLLSGTPERTEGWADFQTMDLGPVRFDQPGKQVLQIRARDPQSWKAINLRWIRLVPEH